MRACQDCGGKLEYEVFEGYGYWVCVLCGLEEEA